MRHSFFSFCICALLSFAPRLNAGGWQDFGHYKVSSDSCESAIQQVVCSPDGDTIYTISKVDINRDRGLVLGTWLRASGAVLRRDTIATSGGNEPIVQISSDALSYVYYGRNPNLNDSVGVKIYSLKTRRAIDSCTLYLGYELQVMDYISSTKDFFVTINTSTITHDGPITHTTGSGLLLRYNWSTGSVRQENFSRYLTFGIKRNVGRRECAVVMDSSNDAKKFYYAGIFDSSMKPISCHRYSNTSFTYMSGAVALGHSHRIVASNLDDSVRISRYDDNSCLQSVPLGVPFTSAEFSADDRYLICLQDKDSSVSFVSTGLEQVCGSFKLPYNLSKAATTYSLNAAQCIVGCANGRLLLISDVVDTLSHDPQLAGGPYRQYVNAPVSYRLRYHELDSARCVWSFGDSQTSNQEYGVHRYSKAGVYTVKAEVSLHGKNYSLAMPSTFEIVAALTPVISVSPAQGPQPLDVRFEYAGSGTPAKCYWYSQDFALDSGLVKSFRYNKYGKYTVQMRVVDGAVDTVINLPIPVVVTPYPTTVLDTHTVVAVAGSSSSSYNETHSTTYNIDQLFQRNDSLLFAGCYSQSYSYSHGNTSYYDGHGMNALRDDLKLGDNLDIQLDYSHGERENSGRAQNGRLSSMWYAARVSISPSYIHFLVNGDMSSRRIGWARRNAMFQYTGLDTGFDCFNYNLVSSLQGEQSILEFRRDSILLKIDSFPNSSVTIAPNQTFPMLCIVNSTERERTTSPHISLRVYSSDYSLLFQKDVARKQIQRFNTVQQIGDDRFVLAGKYMRWVSGSQFEEGALISCINSRAEELWQIVSPNYKWFDLIRPLGKHLIAFYGASTNSEPGFLVVNENGEIKQDFVLPMIGFTGNAYCAARQPGRSYFGGRIGLDGVVISTESQVLRDMLGIQVDVHPEQRETSLLLSPNPTEGRLRVSLSSDNEEQADLEVYDLGGRCVLRQSTQLQVGWNSFALSLEELSTGMYCLRLKSRAGALVQNFVVYR